jgi:TP53 regulating kinase-like protein
MGIPVPAVYFVDEARGEIFMEWIEGVSVREMLDEVLAGEDGVEIVDAIMRRIGATVGALHAAGIVHGDLTTSNIMVKSGDDKKGLAEGEVVLIDFGLGAVSTQDEDKAVDLYVLERAFRSTHPKAEELFQDVLESYQRSSKGAKVVLRRLQDVRMRGRKRSMVG